MAYDYDVEKDILEDIKRVKEKIQEIFYLGQFDIANQFNSKLKKIKQTFLQVTQSKVNSVGLIGTPFETIIYEIAGLEFDVNEFLENGKTLREKQIIEIYENKTNKIISSIATKSTEELFADLTDIVNKWNTYNHSEIEKEIGEERIAKVVLKIVEGQIQKGETIDINVVSNYCSQDIFLDVIRQKLIRIAQKQNKDDANETLEKARFLKQEDLSNLNLWRIITSVENVTIATKKNLQDIEDEKESQQIEPEQEKNEVKEVDESNDIDILNSQLSKLKKLISRVKDKTIYTLVDIDGYTNVRKVFDRFPPRKLSYEDSKKVIEIEIRNKPTITKEDMESLIKCYNKYSEENKLEIFPNMKTLIIGEGVEIIGETIFEAIHDLRNVIIGDTVKEIGNYAFANCYKLQKVSLGRNIEKIGEMAFLHCIMLLEVNIPSSIKKWGDNIFKYCRLLEKNVHIEEGVQEIADLCFEDTGIQNILLPNSIKKIGIKAFKGSFLEEIIIPNGVKEIGLMAFSDCKELKKVHFGENIKHIEDGAFKNCFLESVRIPDSVIYLGGRAFKNNVIRNIHLGKGLEEIKEECFEGFKIVKYIEIPSNIRRIEDKSFAKGEIEHIKFNGFPQISLNAFCESDIDTIQMKENREFINNLVFTGFNSMQKAIIEGKTYKFIQGIFQNRNNKEQYKFAVLTPEALKKFSKTLEIENCKIIKLDYPEDIELYKTMQPIHEEAREQRGNNQDVSQIDGGDGR